MELSLRYYGDPVLRERARRIDVFDDDLREHAEAMVATMRRERGIGLAGPQVGYAKRLIIVVQMKDVDDSDAESLTLVNPEVVERSRETWEHEEGCLSIPGIVGDVLRAERVTIRYQDVEGVQHSLEAEGMFARVLLHEIDHLDGRLFVDYLSAAQKSLLKPRLREITERHVS